MQKNPKFIVITGGVISGLGKGVVTASIGTILQSQGYSVSVIKIDPYINIDAGTMRPTEHGEVFVTDDGGETDQDIGTYERFLGKNFSRSHNITTGKVYRKVIEMERNLEFDGKCVEVIPHIPQEVERRVKAVAERDNADFVLIEVGGTVGDYQNVLFLEAFRSMNLKGDDIAFIHVVYLPVPNNLGEMKTKPAQHSVRMLNQTGIQPDFIIARSHKIIDDVRRNKISLFCNVRNESVISAPDLDTIYELPLIFEKYDFTKTVLNFFGMDYKPDQMKDWEAFVESSKTASREVKIGIVGKYFDIGDFTLEDSYLSVIEAVKHASWKNNAKPVIQWIDSKEFENGGNLKNLDQYDGIIVPGGFGSGGVEGKISAIQYCRENNIPFLGLCYGLQLAVVEFARHACKLESAHTTETDKEAKHPVIDILPEQKKNIQENNYGATMRLGSYPAKLKEGSRVMNMYKGELVNERHRHRFEVNPEYIETLEKGGLVFSGASPDRRLMEFLELPDRKFFVATQAHPEFTSKALRPNPLYLGFIQACLDKK